MTLPAPGRKRPLLRHPAQIVVAGFVAAVLIGTALLMLPIARAGDGSASLVTALFTATSAVCVTGLAVVDTATYWSPFGEAVLMGLVQIGGFGIMTMASLLGFMFARRLGIRGRMTAASESRSLGMGDIRRLLINVAKVTFVFELIFAAVLTVRFMTAYDEPLHQAAYLGAFHAVMAWNNAGFALWSDSLVGFVSDPWICLPVAFAVILGGIGYPVLLELKRNAWRPIRWSLHTKLTLLMSGVLLIGGWIFMMAAEWDNPETMGQYGGGTKVLAGFFHAVQPRSSGFNSLDVGQFHDSTLFGVDILMFIGGGSASTAGGIKVTTFVVLLFVIFSEVRGEPSVTAFGRRIDQRVQRQALTVALLAVAAAVGGTMVMVWITDHRLSIVLFEVISALATVGASTGITGDLPDAAQYLLTALMFLGRLGPVTLVSALAAREKTRHYEYPDERPIIG